MRDLAERRREELAQLVAKHGGTVTPAQVVAFASDVNTALHSLFTWDDTEAAKKYRETEAAAFIRAVVKIVPRGDKEPVRIRAYVALPPDRGGESYRAIENVLGDREMRQQLVEMAKGELIAFRRKYAHLDELAQVWDAIDQSAAQLAA